MRQHLRVTAVLFAVLFFFPNLKSQLWAQGAPPTPQELDQLLSPIALYLDSLLSQIMTASTNTQEILEVITGTPPTLAPRARRSSTGRGRIPRLE